MARTKNFDQEKALVKAMELFWQKGYHGTSMQDLVDVMGISRSSMYDTFGDKHAIFLRAFQYYTHWQQSGIAVSQNSDKSITEFLAAFFNKMLREMVADEERRGCMLVNCATELAWEDESVCAIIHENYETFEGKFLPVFQRAIDSGEIDPTRNPRAMTRFLYVNMVGLRAVSRTTSDIQFLRDSAMVALTSLLK